MGQSDPVARCGKAKGGARGVTVELLAWVASAGPSVACCGARSSDNFYESSCHCSSDPHTTSHSAFTFPCSARSPLYTRQNANPRAGMSARPSLLSSNSSSRRPSAAPSSFPSLPSTRGSSTLGPTTPSAWGAPTPPAPAPEAPPRKKGPSLSLGPAARRTSAPIHPLQHTWEVWFSNRVAGQKGANKDDSKEKESREQWETGVVKLGFFSSVSRFPFPPQTYTRIPRTEKTLTARWIGRGQVESLHPFLAHLTPPSLLPSSSSSTPLISDLNIFKSDIAPAWEDPSNVGGGRWVLRLRKGVADRVWDELVYALVGARLEPDGGSGVNGVVLSVRKDEDILSVWCKPAPRVERELVRSVPPCPCPVPPPPLRFH